MQIIRDNELGGLMMIPLLCDWNIRRCNVKGCTDQPTTIITNATPDCPPIGMCEKHFQEANQDDGGKVFTFEWNDFDAFKKSAALPAPATPLPASERADQEAA